MCGTYSAIPKGVFKKCIFQIILLLVGSFNLLFQKFCEFFFFKSNILIYVCITLKINSFPKGFSLILLAQQILNNVPCKNLIYSSRVATLRLYRQT